MIMDALPGIDPRDRWKDPRTTMRRMEVRRKISRSVTVKRSPGSEFLSDPPQPQSQPPPLQPQPDVHRYGADQSADGGWRPAPLGGCCGHQRQAPSAAGGHWQAPQPLLDQAPDRLRTARRRVRLLGDPGIESLQLTGCSLTRIGVPTCSGKRTIERVAVYRATPLCADDVCWRPPWGILYRS